jgi:thioredoxin-like negative regulator of GroEL
LTDYAPRKNHCLRLAEQGRTDEELTVLCALTDTGSSWAASRLAGELIALNRIEEALDVLRAWEVADDDWAVPWFVENVDRLVALNRIEEALHVLRALADADGRNEVRSRLAELLVQQNQLDELRARADNGDDNAAVDLANLLARHGRTDELQERADAGDFRAAQELTGLLRQEGRLEELRDEVDAGTDGADADLIYLLSVAGEGEQAERIRSFGLNPDRSIADGNPTSHQT